MTTEVQWPGPGRAPSRGARLLLCLLLLQAASVRAEDLSLTNLIAQGDLLSQKHDTRAALQFYLQAEKLSPTNAEIQIKMAAAYCDLMHLTKSKAEQKTLAAQALACGQRAAADDPQSAKAHVCVSVCYAKNFPYSIIKPRSTIRARSRPRRKRPSRWTRNSTFPTTCSAAGIAKWPT